MKYSNLTTKETIMSWKLRFPTHINLKDDNNLHILDWIYTGYRGKSIAKIDLTCNLIEKNANISFVTTNTFRQISHLFIDNFDLSDKNNIVLTSIFESNEQLCLLKNNLIEFNSLLLKKHIGDNNSEKIKDNVIFSELIPYNVQLESDIQHKLGYNTYPIIFLLQHFLLFYSEYNFFSTELIKIKKFQEYNPKLIFSNITFEYKENCSSMHDMLNYFNIKSGDTLIECLNSISDKLRTSSIKNPNIEYINEILNTNQYRELQFNLNNNKIHKPSSKI